ncbi:unnamed protein product [Mytilus coruscus]|uniref:Uncharacterized protein n=1 Tax=Mytilus coruscus TaxID=42192 RepID=A0A6J8CKN5_MYTCO|nr:unnamed protein product [Mytilus coruscus]
MFVLNPFSDGLWTTYCRRKARVILFNSICNKITQYCKENKNISRNKSKDSQKAKKSPPEERHHIELDKNAKIAMAVVSFKNIYTNICADKVLTETDEISDRLFARRGKQHMPMLQLRSVFSKECFQELSPYPDKMAGSSSDKLFNCNVFQDFSGNLSPYPSSTAKHSSFCSSPYVTLSRGSSITTPLYQMSSQQSFDISSDFEIPTCPTSDISPHPDNSHKSIDIFSSTESNFSMSTDKSTYFSVMSVLSKLSSRSSRSAVPYVTLRSPLSEQGKSNVKGPVQMKSYTKGAEQVKSDAKLIEQLKSGAEETELVNSGAKETEQAKCRAKGMKKMLPLLTPPDSVKSTQSFTFPHRELTHEMESDARGLKKMFLTLTPKSTRPRSFTF